MVIFRCQGGIIMRISKRQEIIINHLLRSDEYITAKKMSERLGMSEKTVYREINSIKHIFGFEKDIIEKKAGSGYKLNYKKYIQYISELGNVEDSARELTIEDRRTDIIIDLLVHSPQGTSINKLSNKYYVSPASIVKDLNEIEQQLAKYDLKLSRDSCGTNVVGSEEQIRQVLVKIINLNVLDSRAEMYEDNQLSQSDFQNFSKHFDELDVGIIKKSLDSARQLSGFILENPYYINLFTHLLIAVQRIRAGKIKKGLTEPVLTEVDTKEINFQKEIIRQMEASLNLSLPAAEKEYIQLFLTSSRNTEESQERKMELFLNDQKDDQKKAAIDIIYSLTEAMTLAIGTNFNDDKILKETLYLHIKPLLNRLKYQIDIVNPLTTKIKEEFPEIFNELQIIMAGIILKHSMNRISEDEIAYIALYFQSSLERKVKQKNVLIVCSTGIGTSHLLENRVKKAFPDWNIVDVVSSSKVKSFTEKATIDLILSTVKLEASYFPVIIVNVFFGAKDIDNVKKFLEKK